MYNVLYSPEFLRDLQEIEDYITYQLRNRDSASEVTDGLLLATDALKNFPERGKPLYLPDGTYTGYRAVIVGNYMAVYRVFGSEIQVARAVHTSQDYLQKLFPWIRHTA